MVVGNVRASGAMRALHLFTGLLVLSLSAGCHWVRSKPKRPDGGSDTSGESGGGAKGGIDEAVYAPPDGLPDLRPIVGLDPNHWAPAFMPAFTQQVTREEVVEKMAADFERVDANDKETLVTMVPKEPENSLGFDRSCCRSWRTRTTATCTPTAWS